MAFVMVDRFAGVPLYYDRYNRDAYGRSAVAMRAHVDAAFAAGCERAFTALVKLLGDGGFAVTQIWSGGVGRAGTGRSYHHKNRAFDLDALIFADGSKWVADTFPERPFMYLAIEAVLRTEFGTVLNFDYNRAHEDHFHFDNGRAPGFKPEARSHALFVQHCLDKLFNQDIGESGVDGLYGPDTDAALTRVRRALHLGGLSSKKTWQAFLRHCADAAIDKERSIVTAPDALIA